MTPQFDEYLQFEKILQLHQELQTQQTTSSEAQHASYWTFETTQSVQAKGTDFPLWKITCENKSSLTPSKDKACLILVGGIHGLERIGSQLCVSLIEKYYELSRWDYVFKHELENVKIVFFPFANPAGIQNRTRSNNNGVDLMRNAPITATDKIPFLLGGQNYSTQLPWFRGTPEKMETESQYLADEISQIVNSSRLTISIDIHSGFGFKDQLWFPWAFTKKPFPRLDLITAMMDYFEKLYPFHIYKIEPQSKVYCTHGDLWDYIAHEKVEKPNYLPFTLELGSWIWVKKNPLQVFKLDGLFNPIKKHRIKRTLRRHQSLIDFTLRFLLFAQKNDPKSFDKHDYYNKGLKKWYPELPDLGS